MKNFLKLSLIICFIGVYASGYSQNDYNILSDSQTSSDGFYAMSTNYDIDSSTWFVSSEANSHLRGGSSVVGRTMTIKAVKISNSSIETLYSNSSTSNYIQGSIPAPDPQEYFEMSIAWTIEYADGSYEDRSLLIDFQ